VLVEKVNATNSIVCV